MKIKVTFIAEVEGDTDDLYDDEEEQTVKEKLHNLEINLAAKLDEYNYENITAMHIVEI
jgi:hypothetical protein